MAGEEATHVYGKGHICGRVVAGIKGRIHVMFIFIVVPEIHWLGVLLYSFWCE